MFFAVLVYLWWWVVVLIFLSSKLRGAAIFESEEKARACGRKRWKRRRGEWCAS